MPVHAPTMMNATERLIALELDDINNNRCPGVSLLETEKRVTSDGYNIFFVKGRYFVCKATTKKGQMFQYPITLHPDVLLNM